MAHWAEVNKNNIVTRVTVGNNNESDEGYQWLVDNLGGTWLKTSYNTYGNSHSMGGAPFRGNYAGIGFKYREDLDAFIPPKPYDSWVLNEDTCLWEAPLVYPGGQYSWSEEETTWVPAPQPYPSWVWNDEFNQWESPTPRPNPSGSEVYAWDEESASWIIS